MKMARKWLVLLILCATAAALLCGIKTEVIPDAVTYNRVRAPEGTWTQEEQDGPGAVCFTGALPQGEEPQVMLLQSHWNRYRVAVDGAEIFAVDGGLASPCRLLKLPRGETLTVRFFYEDPDAAAAIRQSRLLLGDKSSVYRMLVRENLHAVVFAAFALVLGCMGIAAGAYTNSKRLGGPSRSLVSLGLFILCAGVWILTDSKFLLLVTERTGLVETISFLAFFTLPILLLGFTKNMIPRRERIFETLQLLLEGMLLLYAVNQIFEVLPVTPVIVAEHVLMAVTIALVICFGFQEVRGRRNRKLHRVMVGYSVFAACSVAALAAYYRGDSQGYSVAYVVGMLGFIICLADAAWLAVFDYVKESEKVALYARMAYVDMMTGLGNRAAFQEEMERDAAFSGPVGYIMVDANDLKTVNDTQGHHRGDELLRCVARCMERAVGEAGSCYRIGGDEFVIRQKGRSSRALLECMEAVQAELRAAAAGSDLPISAAMGCAWAEGADKDLQQLLRRADDSMYGTKKKMKERGT